MTTKYADGGFLKQSVGAGKLVARYVWSGNTVIQPTAINLTTGVLNVSSSLTAQGFAVGSYYNIMVVAHSFNTKIFPKEFNPLNDYFMYVASDTTIQLSTSGSSAGLVSSYPDASNTAVDPTQWHLEWNSSLTFQTTTINLTGLNLSEIRVKWDIVGRDRGSWPYVYLNGTSSEGAFSNFIGGGIDGREGMALFLDEWWKYNPETKTLWGSIMHGQSFQWGNNTSGTWTSQAINDSSTVNQWRPLTNFKITGVQLAISVANGSVIEIYDVKGGY